jgi:thiol:disulfide interchange protein
MMLKADLTHFQTEETSTIRDKFRIMGVPTIVFIDKNGSEIRELRLVEFEEADPFLERMLKSLK